MWTCSALPCSRVVAVTLWPPLLSGHRQCRDTSHICPPGAQQLLPVNMARGSGCRFNCKQEQRSNSEIKALMTDPAFQPGVFVPSQVENWRELVSHHKIHPVLWHQLGPGSFPPFPARSPAGLEQLRAPRFSWMAANPAVLVTGVTEGQEWCNNT